MNFSTVTDSAWSVLAGKPPRRGSLFLRERVFAGLALAAGLLVPLVLAGIIAALARGAWKVFSAFGFGFLFDEVWNPVTSRFGAAASIYGTLVTSAIAMIVAVPVAIGIAIFLTELCPVRLRRPVALALELLAGIPSIVFGFWGLFVLAPYMQGHVQPALIRIFSDVPLLSSLFTGPPFGIGILTAGLILAIMVLPFIGSVVREVFEATPATLRESGYALGCTTWEVTRRIVLPHARSAVVGASMLGLGRALGETMAVTFVIGNAHHISASLLAPGTTISATIANEFTEAVGDLYTSSLIALGLVLFVITFAVLAAARLLLPHTPRATS